MPSTTMRFLSSLSLSVVALFASAGCNNGGLSPGGKVGYLASDRCTRNASPDACSAAGDGCHWVEIQAVDFKGSATVGAPAVSPPGACVAEDPCLALDETGCRSNGSCAWSAVRSLCPIGARCGESGGFCHKVDDSGTDCACVSPMDCPDDTACPVECDCSGGGSGGSGGACTCACPACAPGETCPPCACDCDDGGSGCTEPGTCVTSCPTTCTPGSDCACATVCSGGAATGTTMAGGTAPGSSDPTGAAPQPTAPPCTCGCPPCAPGESCPPCACDCGSGGGGTGTGNTGTGCVPPPVPSPTPCAEVACALYCPNGFAKDANDCFTCNCN